MDAFVLARLAAALRQHWNGAWIQGAWEDVQGRLLLRLRHRGRTGHLLLSSLRATSGVGIVSRRTECPPRPTALAAYVRAHGRGQLLSAACVPYERVLCLTLGGIDRSITVVLETVPRSGCLLALDDRGVVRAMGGAAAGSRRLFPGEAFVPPPLPPEQLSPPQVSPRDLEDWLAAEEPWHRRVLGVGPALAREIGHRAAESGAAEAWCWLLAQYGTEGPLWRYPDQLSAMELLHRAEQPCRCPDALVCAGEWLLEDASRQQESSAETRRTQLHKRFRKKLQRRIANIEADLAALADPETLRLQADALAAGLWQVRPGAERARVVDPRDPGVTCSVDLDPALTPGQNLDRLYHRVRKIQRTRAALQERLARSRRELEAGPSADALRPAGTPQRPGQAFRRYRSSDGWSIRAGRNAVENDRLLREARPWDVWLHARDAAGAHVVIRKPGRESRVPDRTLWEAAGIAALWSRRAEEGAAEVMVAEVARVRKPKGAGPGQVVVAGERTLRVKPGAGGATPESD